MKEGYELGYEEILVNYTDNHDDDDDVPNIHNCRLNRLKYQLICFL